MYEISFVADPSGKEAVSASEEPRTALSVVFTRRGSHCSGTPLPVLPVRKQILREIYVCVPADGNSVHFRGCAELQVRYRETALATAL